MIFDFFVFSPPVFALFFRKNWVLTVFTFCGLVATEFFSTLPFIMLSLPLVLGVITIRFLLGIFDATSFLSFLFAYSGGVLVRAGGTLVAQSYYSKAWSSEYLVRGGIFLLRELTFGFFLAFSIIALRYSLVIIQRAFEKEKNL